MPEVLKKRILKFLAHRDYEPMKLAALAKAVDVSDDEADRFDEAFEQLRKAGKVVAGGRGLVSLPKFGSTVIGRFRANPKGFGFVMPFEAAREGDLFIADSSAGMAMTGDTVLARVSKKTRTRGQVRYVGEIIEILERRNNRFVGTLIKQGKQWQVEADGKEFIEPIEVGDVGAKGAKAGDKVVVEVITYPAGNDLARGVITEVLGAGGTYKAEIASTIRQFNLPGEFSDDLLEETRKIIDGFDAESADGRDDISAEVVITIDPPDAKDFDDAISLTKNSDGNWVLGVHIADVSNFVEMGSLLDVEAKQRGNSVYLPGKVIPMLPEALSNGICSLQPGQRRFAKSVYITYDENGNVLGQAFANSIICSRARLTYDDAEKILKGKAADFAGEVVALLKDMEVLARAIEKRRIANGMLELDLPETELVMDSEGKIIDAHPADMSYPHKIIEMFMVEANESAAAVIDRFGVPFMRRIHPEPDSLSIKNVSRFISICGFNVPRKLDRKAIQDILAAAKGRQESFAINMHVLRSFAKAEYSPLDIGHFALASGQYCHFTSPIRRYADLLVHRLLQCYLEQRLNMIGLEEALPQVELTEIGKHITFTEQQATGAERDLKAVLILQMLSGRIGEKLETVVSGVTNFGIFVQCKKFGIEGLININELGADQWKFDSRTQAIVGENSGKSLRLGQGVTVKIVSVNVAARQLDLALLELLVKGKAREKKKTTKKKSRRKNKRRI